MCFKEAVPYIHNVVTEFALEVTLQVQLISLFCRTHFYAMDT